MLRGVNTREYLTILHCTPLLVTAVKDNIAVLSDKLLAEGLITPVNYGALRNTVIDETVRASKLVEFVRNKISLNSKNYYSFINTLEKEKANYRDILLILNEKYEGEYWSKT